MNLEERTAWLLSLKTCQLQALACQNCIPGWNTRSANGLRSLLQLIDGVETPVQA